MHRSEEALLKGWLEAMLDGGGSRCQKGVGVGVGYLGSRCGRNSGGWIDARHFPYQDPVVFALFVDCHCLHACWHGTREALGGEGGAGSHGTVAFALHALPSLKKPVILME